MRHGREPRRRVRFARKAYALQHYSLRKAFHCEVPYECKPTDRTRACRVHVHKMCVRSRLLSVCRLLCGAARTTLRGSPPG